MILLKPNLKKDMFILAVVSYNIRYGGLLSIQN